MLRGSLFQALIEIVGSAELRKRELETKVEGKVGRARVATSHVLSMKQAAKNHICSV